MLGKLIPLVIGLAGLGAGVGAGIALRPHDEPPEAAHGETLAANPCGESTPHPAGGSGTDQPATGSHATAPSAKTAGGSSSTDAHAIKNEFVKLSNDFVFPLIEGGKVASLIVLSLSLEVSTGQSDAVRLREPKLRDGFLRVLLDYAHTGGFAGSFTSTTAMDKLRVALLEKGREDLGNALRDVLILDINRQDA